MCDVFSMLSTPNHPPFQHLDDGFDVFINFKTQIRNHIKTIENPNVISC
jgi:hypothetical protein